MLLLAVDELVTFRSTNTHTHTWPPLRRTSHCRDLSAPLDHRTGQFNVIQIKNRRVSNELRRYTEDAKDLQVTFINCF